MKLDGYKSPQKTVIEATPLAMIPPSPLVPAPVPYLTKEIVEGITTRFL